MMNPQVDLLNNKDNELSIEEQEEDYNLKILKEYLEKDLIDHGYTIKKAEKEVQPMDEGLFAISPSVDEEEIISEEPSEELE